jgi:hypothetical protein
MTNQPAPGDDGTPNGYPPPSYIPPQGPEIPPPPPASPQFQQPDAGPWDQGRTPPAPHGNQYPQPGPYGQQPGPYGNAYGQPSYYGMPPEPKTLSIASLCCGVAVFLGFGFFILPQVAAVVLGHMGLKREPAGRGLAVAGLVLGYIGLALTAIVLLVAVLAIFTAANSGFGY